MLGVETVVGFSLSNGRELNEATGLFNFDEYSSKVIVVEGDQIFPLCLHRVNAPVLIPKLFALSL